VVAFVVATPVAIVAAPITRRIVAWLTQGDVQARDARQE
jgi:hypothetical protein